MATYKHLRSSTANKRPTTSIADGQLAINTNTASPGLFFKDSAGTGIVKVGPVHVGTTAPNSVPASGGSTGNYLGEQWLDTSVSPAQMKVWNGSIWVGIVADELPVSKLQDGAARQLIQTDAAGTGVEWTSNVDVPGTLDVTSTATFDSIAQYPLGSAGAPTITFTGDTNTGIYSPGADQVAISTGGSGRLFVDASGRVGIGTASPSVPLEVSDAGSPQIKVVRPTGVDLRLNAYYGGDLASLTVVTNHPLALHTNNTERLRITSAGLVGVGTSSPSSLLHLASGGIHGITLERTGAAPSIDRVFNESDLLVLENNTQGISLKTGTTPADRIRITSAGLVGIGTTSPGVRFDVVGQGRFDHTAVDAITVLRSGTTVGDIGGTSGGGAFSFRSATSVPITFNIATAEAARIDSSGRLLVGTSTSSSPNALLQVSKTGSAVVDVRSSSLSNNDDASFVASDGASAIGQIGVFKHTGIASACAYLGLRAQDGGTNFYWSDNSDIFRTSTDATNIGTTGGTVVGTQTSDERLKDIHGPVEYGLETVKQLQPVRFALKSDPNREQLGFIAQQVQPLVPQSVFDTKERIEGEPEDAPTKLGMEYVALIPVLVNAIKELSAEVDSLKAQLT